MRSFVRLVRKKIEILPLASLLMVVSWGEKYITGTKSILRRQFTFQKCRSATVEFWLLPL
jgi:hypothetical protein